jgi:SAM-dependent methyltransferase
MSSDHDEQVSVLNRIAPELGWEQALKRVFSKDFLEYFDRKPVFLDVLPLNDADVLEIGPGFGQFTPLIAQKAKSVVALEVDSGQAQFLSERVRQQGLSNVRVHQGGADCRLPFSDDSFDLIILNLVFEWCGLRSPDGHELAQRRLLSEMWRVLRPGGQLYLATKNRFAVRYLMGKADEHMGGVRFGSALPRWLSKRVPGGRASGMLHSFPQLQRMLREAKFEILRSWWAVPDMRNTLELVPTDTRSVRAARRRGVRQGGSRGEALLIGLLPSALVKFVAPGINLLARKPGN